MDIPEPLDWQEAKYGPSIYSIDYHGKSAEYQIRINPGSIDYLDNYEDLIFMDVSTDDLDLNNNEVYMIMSPDKAEEIAVRLLTVAEYARKEWEKQHGHSS